jgi:hypothetical protein
MKKVERWVASLQQAHNLEDPLYTRNETSMTLDDLCDRPSKIPVKRHGENKRKNEDGDGGPEAKRRVVTGAPAQAPRRGVVPVSGRRAIVPRAMPVMRAVV